MRDKRDIRTFDGKKHQNLDDFSFRNSFEKASKNQFNGRDDGSSIPSKEDMDKRAAELTEQLGSIFCPV